MPGPATHIWDVYFEHKDGKKRHTTIGAKNKTAAKKAGREKLKLLAGWKAVKVTEVVQG